MGNRGRKAGLTTPASILRPAAGRALPAALLLCLFLDGCAAHPAPLPQGENAPRVEVKRSMRRLETLDLQGSLSGSSARIEEAQVLDVYIYDTGAQGLRHEVVARVFPQVAAALRSPDEDETTLLVRLFVVPGDDPHQAWATSLRPRQVRAISRMDEAERTRALAQIPWGYTERHRM